MQGEFHVGQNEMNEMKQKTFDWGAFVVNASPFFLALIIVLGLFRSSPGAVIIALVCPLLMLATLIPIVFCLRRGLAPWQRVITIVLDVVAFGFYGFVSWGVFMTWRIGPLTH